MENKIAPKGFESSIQHRPRWARLLAGGLALALGASLALAQNAVSTLAGTGSSGSANGTGTAASFSFTRPSGIAVDSAGNIYVADALNHLIRKVTSAGVVTTFAGSGTAGSADATGTAATFNRPQGLAIDGAGNLYVADTFNHAIRMITSAGVVTTLAGTAPTSGRLDGTGAAARFDSPLGIAADRAGAGGAAVNVFVADTQNNSIRQIVVGTKVVTTLAGSTAGASGSNNAVGTAATFFHPDAIVSNPAGTTLYVADTFNHLIRQIAIAAGPTATVTTLAGSGTQTSVDGTGILASFNSPSGIGLDGAGNILVSDTGAHTIRSITSGGVVTTIAGAANSSGTANGLATATARFNVPSGIAFDVTTNGTYVVDTNNQTIRRIAAAVAPSVTAQPTNVAATAGTNVSFTATGTGNPAVSYQWQIQVAGAGAFTNVTANATYTGSTTQTLTVNGVTSGMSGDKFQCVISNDFGVAATSSIATLTVTQAPAFTSAASANFTVGTAGSFTVAATGTPAPSFSRTGTFPSWAAFNTSTGVISGTPTDASGSPFSFTISATNSAGTVNQAFTLTVLTGPSIATQPANQSISPGQSVSFSVAATSNGGTLTYQWQRQAAGTAGFANIDAGNSVYTGANTATLTISSPTQPMGGDKFKVVVSSGVGTPATSSEATLTVTQPPQITSLSSATFVENQSGTFTVLATGSPAPTFTLTSGALPAGVTLAPATGVISGTPAAGTSASSPFLVQITASNGVNPGATQNFSLAVSPTALAPAFTTQPANLTVALGQTATFTVVVTGNPTPTLRWQRYTSASGQFLDITDDATFSGATTATLTINNPPSGMSGDIFRASALNSSGSGVVYSSSATLSLVIGTTISTLAGQASVSGAVDATGVAARFNGLAGVAVDSSGNLYIADTSNHVIRKISSAGVVTTLAGTAGMAGSVDGTGAAARFNAPAGLALGALGTVYVADTYNHAIRVIATDGVVTTLAGSAGNPGSADGQGSAARFLYPYSVAVDSAGTVSVADTFNHIIRRVTSSGSVTTFAGTAGARGTVNAAGTAARFAYPFSLALDSGGNLYVADSYNHAVRKIDVAGNVTALAGNPGTVGSVDGTGTAALFNQPSGIAVDSAGDVYVADTYNNTIRKVTAAGVVTTLAGVAGSAGSSDGVGTAARFNQPFGIAVDSSKNVFIADTRNHTVRRSGNVAAPSITTHPQAVVAAAGGTATLTVAASGTPAPSIFTWMRQAAGTSGFTALAADSVYSGVGTATLSITGVTSAMNGDQFQVVVSNLISPTATSNAATLTIGTAPVFTSPATASFRATEAGSFTIAATGSPTPTFSATGLPPWASLNPTTGALTGTPPDTIGSPFTVTVTASNGITATQVLNVVVTPAVFVPTITNHPSNVMANQGNTVVFSVAASGTAPFTYQWNRNGVAVAGGTDASLTLLNVQPATAGSFTAVVSNSAGSVTSNAASLIVNTAPVLAQQPQSQTAVAGSTVTFSVNVTGGNVFTYRWYKFGVAIPGANASSLTLNNVSSADVGNYDVEVTNDLGTVRSSLAQLSVVTSPVAPVFTSQPGNRTVLQGNSVTLTAVATGAPTPGYQWRKNGSNINGATNSSYAITGVEGGELSRYDVVVSNAAGSATSATALVRTLARSFAGTYFGSFAGNLGNFAILVRDDNSGVFLGYLPVSAAPVMSLNISVADNGTFSFSQGAIASAAASVSDGTPARAAALSTTVVNATIGLDGSVAGAVAGGANAALTASRANPSGASNSVAGFYQAGASNSAALSYTIAGSNNQAFAIIQSGNTFDGGLGTVTTAGAVNVATARSFITANISASSGSITASASGGITASFTGANESNLALQRLVNISSRTRVGTGDAVAIAGFVIAGLESKPVLIRAVGPTLASAFGVSGTLAAPRLVLNRGQTALATSTGIAGDRVAIDAAGLQAGAFALGSAGTDAAILTTLAPGAYTAVVSSATGAAGIALVEVYDLSTPARGEKLLNIATRATAGAGDNTLIAGFVVPAGATKRVLVRGVGPGLAAFGVSGTLAQPTLRLQSGDTVLASNTNWATSQDRDAITAASVQVGAFGLAANDSALIATLAPGNYTANVVGAGNATGVALIEVYELP